MKRSHFESLKRMVAVSLALTMFSLGVGAPRIEAMVMPSQTGAAMVGSASDRATVQAALESKVVRQRLHELGLSDVEIDRRIGRLSPDQLHQVAMQIDQQTPAGDGTGVAITVLVVVLLVLLILRLADDID